MFASNRLLRNWAWNDRHSLVNWNCKKNLLQLIIPVSARRLVGHINTRWKVIVLKKIFSLIFPLLHIHHNVKNQVTHVVSPRRILKCVTFRPIFEQTELWNFVFNDDEYWVNVTHARRSNRLHCLLY